MRYRDHKGSLKESLKTTITVDAIKDLQSHLESQDIFNRKIETIKFEYIGFDYRIAWNSYYVLQKFKNADNFTVAGISDDFLS